MESIVAVYAVLGFLVVVSLWLVWWVAGISSDVAYLESRLKWQRDSLKADIDRVWNTVGRVQGQLAEPKDITKEELEEELGYRINITN